MRSQLRLLLNYVSVIVAADGRGANRIARCKVDNEVAENAQRWMIQVALIRLDPNDRRSRRIARLPKSRRLRFGNVVSIRTRFAHTKLHASQRCMRSKATVKI